MKKLKINISAEQTEMSMAPIKQLIHAYVQW